MKFYYLFVLFVFASTVITASTKGDDGCLSNTALLPEPAESGCIKNLYQRSWRAQDENFAAMNWSLEEKTIRAKEAFLFHIIERKTAYAFSFLDSFCGNTDIGFLDFCNGVGQTPLMLACSIGDCNLVKRLLDLGALVELRDSNGYDAFWYAACVAINKDIVTLILNKKSDLIFREYAVCDGKPVPGCTLFGHLVILEKEYQDKINAVSQLPLFPKESVERLSVILQGVTDILNIVKRWNCRKLMGLYSH